MCAGLLAIAAGATHQASRRICGRRWYGLRHSSHQPARCSWTTGPRRLRARRVGICRGESAPQRGRSSCPQPLRLGAMRPALVGLALLCAAASSPFSRCVRDPDAVGTDPRSAAPVPVARVALFRVLIWLYSGTEMALGGWLPELARRLPSAASTAGSAAVGRGVLGAG